MPYCMKNYIAVQEQDGSSENELRAITLIQDC